MGKIPEGYWPCACVRRDENGNMTHIAMHPPTRRMCKVCGSTRPPKGWDKKPAGQGAGEGE